MAATGRVELRCERENARWKADKLFTYEISINNSNTLKALKQISRKINIFSYMLIKFICIFPAAVIYEPLAQKPRSGDGEELIRPLDAL